MRRSLLFFTGLTLVAMACAPAQSSTGSSSSTSAPESEKRSENQVIKIAQVGLPPTLTLDGSQSNHHNYWPLYDNLIALDEKFNLIPQVAERWELVDGQNWRLSLRKDMTFSNGDKLTAADVEFTIKYVLQNKTPQVGQISSVTDAKIIDDYTIDVINKQPDASTLAGLPFL
jgi:peptide/nickel transport system substrate-binding protein